MTLLLVTITFLVVAIVTIFLDILQLACLPCQSRSSEACKLLFMMSLCESSSKRLLKHPVNLLVHIMVLLQIAVFAFYSKNWKEPSSAVLWKVLTYGSSKTLPLMQIVFNVERSLGDFSSLLSWSTAVTIFFCKPNKSSLNGINRCKSIISPSGDITKNFSLYFSFFSPFYQSSRDQTIRFQICWLHIEGLLRVIKSIFSHMLW